MIRLNHSNNNYLNNGNIVNVQIKEVKIWQNLLETLRHYMVKKHLIF